MYIKVFKAKTFKIVSLTFNLRNFIVYFYISDCIIKFYTINLSNNCCELYMVLGSITFNDVLCKLQNILGNAIYRVVLSI